MEKVFERIPGDKVWVMNGNKAVCGTIESAFFCRGISCVNFTSINENEEYTVRFEDNRKKDFKPKDLFSTKEELIDSL